jgi:hypothetical protein
MKIKLTLSIDEDLVQFAHQQAKHSGQSVSNSVSEFLRDRQTDVQKQAIPSVAEMVGLLKSSKIDDSKAGIRGAYAKKYLNRY